MEQDELDHTLLAAELASQGSCLQECASAQLRLRLRLDQEQKQLPGRSFIWQVVVGRNEHFAVSEPGKHRDSPHRT